MKDLTILLTIILAICLPYSAKAFLFGDINGDDRIGLEDSIASIQIAAGLSPDISIPLTRTIVVSAEPGDPLASGVRLRAVFSEVSSNATADDPWLVRIGPGEFDVGGSALIIPSYVNVEGAGRNSTLITRNTTGGSPSTYFVMLGESTILSDLSIHANVDTTTYAVHVTTNTVSTIIRNVDVKVVGGTTVRGINVQDEDSVELPNRNEIIFTNVSIELLEATDSYGVYLLRSKAKFFNVDIAAHADEKNVGIYGLNSTILAEHTGIIAGGDLATHFATGRTDGISLNRNGVIFSGSLTLKDSDVAAFGGSEANGVTINTQTIANIERSKIKATASSTYTRTIYNFGLADVIYSHIESIGANSNWSLFNTSDGAGIDVSFSRIIGETRDDSSVANIVIKVSEMTPTSDSDILCVGVWENETGGVGAFYPSTCP